MMEMNKELKKILSTLGFIAFGMCLALLKILFDFTRTEILIVICISLQFILLYYILDILQKKSKNP